jgi:hypothetical protein
LARLRGEVGSLLSDIFFSVAALIAGLYILRQKNRQADSRQEQHPGAKEEFFIHGRKGDRQIIGLLR